MAYEVFHRRVRRVGAPSITLNRAGRVSFNKAASERMRKLAVESVALLWDANARKFAIRPMAKKDPRAYQLHFGNRDNGAGFSAVTFMEHIGFDYKAGSRQFPAEWNEEQGMFEVSLADADEADEAPLLQAVGSPVRRRERQK